MALVALWGDAKVQSKFAWGGSLNAHIYEALATCESVSMSVGMAVPDKGQRSMDTVGLCH